jgi:hypothetical protein
VTTLCIGTVLGQDDAHAVEQMGWHTATAMDQIVAKVVLSETVGLAVGFAVFAAVSGALTGLTLVWLLRHPVLTVPDAPS